MLSNYFRTISTAALSALLAFCSSSSAQSTSSSSDLFADLGGVDSAYEENYPHFLQAQKVIVLSVMTSGLVNNISALPQDYVNRGQKLLTIDSELIELEIQSLKDQIKLSSAMAEATIKYEFATDNLKIVEELYNRNIGDARAGSLKELKEATQSRDLAREGVKHADLELKTLKNQLAQKNKQLEYYTINAPENGVMVPFSSIKNLENSSLKQVREGEVVQAAQPVMAMLKVDKLRLRFKQPRTQLSNVKIGQNALVHIQGFDRPEKATIVYIEPTIIEALDEFYIEVEVNNPETNNSEIAYPFTYYPGMRARVELQ